MLTAKQNAAKLYAGETPEYLPIMGQGIVNNVPVDGYRERSEVGKTGPDWFGVEWLWEPGQPAPMPTENEIVLEDICDWREAVKFPDLDAWDWKAAAARDRIGTFDFENNLLYQMIHNGLFERLHELMGFENAMCSLLTDPEEVSAFFGRLADYKCALADKLHEYYHPDIICYHDDWGTQRGLFFSPDTWRELLKEPTRRIVEHVHSLGMRFEMHSCGDIRPLVPELVNDLHVDALNIQRINDIPTLKKLTGGRAVFDVFLDTQSLDARQAAGDLTEAEFRAAIRNELLALAPGGCYIPQLLMVRPEWVPWIMEEYEKVKFTLY